MTLVVATENFINSMEARERGPGANSAVEAYLFAVIVLSIWSAAGLAAAGATLRLLLRQWRIDKDKPLTQRSAPLADIYLIPFWSILAWVIVLFLLFILTAVGIIQSM
jgi:hypothetical protein